MFLVWVLVQGNKEGMPEEQNGQYEGEAQWLAAETSDGGEGYLEELLFLGDSNTLRMEGYGLLDAGQVLAVKGMGIAGVTANSFIYIEGSDRPLTMAQAVVQLQPRGIVMTFGTNDVGNMTQERFIQAYADAVEEIREGYGGTILVTAIPPIAQDNDYPKLTRREIESFNLALQEFCRQEGLLFVNIEEALADEEGWARPGTVTTDGIHYTQQGLEAWLLYLRTHAAW